MNAYNLVTGKEVLPGQEVPIYKLGNDNKGWLPIGESGIFECVTLGGLINFTHKGKPRQCMPEGIGVRVE